jgi:hypothetical protein
VPAPESGDPPWANTTGRLRHKEAKLLMSCAKPTEDGHAVVLATPAVHCKFLRDLFEIARNGIREELAQYPKQLKEPRRLHREEAVYDMLLAALDNGSIVADRDVRDVVRDLAEIYDRENEYERVVSEHEALHGLLDQISVGEGNVR